MLRIVMDSAGDMPSEWAEKYGIDIIPINIQFGERTYLQGIDINNADFYRMAVESKIFPQTSQPSPQQFIDLYNRIAEPGDAIISIHITAKLSGTFNSAVIAARELASRYKIYPIDSAGGSASMGYMCREARLMQQAGFALERIVDRMNSIASKVSIILTLDTLEFARRSGRVKALQAALASLLNVKPILILREGILEMGDRVRTRGKALDYVVDCIVERVGDQLVNAAVVQAEDPESGQILMNAVRSRLNCKELMMTQLSIGIAANLGPGTVGVVAYPSEGGL